MSRESYVIFSASFFLLIKPLVGMLLALWQSKPEP
jgi:hypothetical protein